MTAEEAIARQIALNRIALLEARTAELCALLEPDPAEWERLKAEHRQWVANFTAAHPEWQW